MAWWEYLFFQVKYTLHTLDYSRFTSLQSYAACSFFLNFPQTLATVPSCAFVRFLLLFIFSLIFWFQFYFQSGFEHLKACMSGSVWGGVQKKRKKELKLLKFDLTLELIISCWESRKCCVWDSFSVSISCLHVHLILNQPNPATSIKIPFLIYLLVWQLTSQACNKHRNEVMSLCLHMPSFQRLN